MDLGRIFRKTVIATGLVTALGTSELAMPFSAQAGELNLKIGDSFPVPSGELMGTIGWHKEKGACIFKECDINNDPNIIAIVREYDVNNDRIEDIGFIYTNCQNEEQRIVGLGDENTGYFGPNGKVTEIISGEDFEKTNANLSKYIPSCK